MIVDSSALVSVLLGEADGKRLAGFISEAVLPRMSADNWLETAMVIDRRGDADAAARFDNILHEFNIEVAAFTAEARAARVAWSRFGKGSGHPAQLNFGDCIAYATAKEAGEALLFKGRDFVHTDIEPALKD